MKLQTVDRVVASSHEFASTQCTIDAEDMKYIASLLRDNYSDTILATIRETFANAVDATEENNQSVSKIIVTLPTYLEPTFSVRDFGAGISSEKIRSLYTKYGKSTKRDSDSQRGAFGIGKFAPLSYNKDGFTITSFVDGEKRVYLMYISEENDTKIDELYCGPTDEPNGICISVAVSKEDINSFINSCNKFFTTFDELPTFVNLPNPISKDKKILSGKNWYIRSDNSDCCVVMGGISYPLNFSVIDFHNPIKHVLGLVFIIPIGSVKLHHSRESLEYNKITKDFLIAKCLEVDRDIRDIIEEKFQKFDCLKVAKQEFTKLYNSLPYELMYGYIQSSNSPFKYKNVVITDDHFNKGYFKDEKGNDCRIPVRIRRYELNRPGNNVTQSRTYNISVREDTALVINDCDEKTKIMCRILNLLKNDSGKTYKDVIVIGHDSESSCKNIINGAEKFASENRFDLVITDVFKLSDLPVVKIPTKAKSGATYNSSYYFSTSLTKRKFNTASKTEIEDASLIKPYIEVMNRLPLPEYDGLKVDNRLNIYFFERFTKCFKSEVYGVSIAVSDSVKFKKQTHFIKLYDYIKECWDSISASDKQFIKDVRALHYDSNCSFEFLKKLHDKNPECIKELADILDSQKTIKNDARFNSMKNFIEFFSDYLLHYNFFSKMIVDAEDYRKKTIESFCKEQLRKYPLLDKLSGINSYSCGDYQLFLSQCADYVVSIDKQTQKIP